MSAALAGPGPLGLAVEASEAQIACSALDVEDGLARHLVRDREALEGELGSGVDSPRENSAHRRR